MICIPLAVISAYMRPSSSLLLLVLSQIKLEFFFFFQQWAAAAQMASCPPMRGNVEEIFTILGYFRLRHSCGKWHSRSAFSANVPFALLHVIGSSKGLLLNQQLRYVTCRNVIILVSLKPVSLLSCAMLNLSVCVCVCVRVCARAQFLLQGLQAKINMLIAAT